MKFPPPVGVYTLMLSQPGRVMSVSAICEVSWVELTKVVARGLLFQATVELEMKFDPFTVSVNAAPLGLAEVGLTLVTRGELGCAA